jgi:hypothetical protein
MSYGSLGPELVRQGRADGVTLGAVMSGMLRHGQAGSGASR